QREHIATEEARLQRITARLAQLVAATNNDRQNDVVLKRSEPLTLLGLRRRVLGQGEIGPFAVSVVERLAAENLWLLSALVRLSYEFGPVVGEHVLCVGAWVSGSPGEPAVWVWPCIPAG